MKLARGESLMLKRKDSLHLNTSKYEYYTSPSGSDCNSLVRPINIRSMEGVIPARGLRNFASEFYNRGVDGKCKWIV